MLSHIDNGNLSILTLLDLSAAFDTIVKLLVLATYWKFAEYLVIFSLQKYLAKTAKKDKMLETEISQDLSKISRA